MKAHALWAVLALALAGCGSDRASNLFAGTPQMILAALQPKAAALDPTATSDDPAIRAGILNFRKGLEKDGQPIILASNGTLRYGTLLAPFGGNNGVKTWSSTSYQTISLRDGMMVATRGFGPDLMSSVMPTTAKVSTGQGTTERRYMYLDGADQPQTLDFRCELAFVGSESIEVMAKPYQTRKVTETCGGKAGRFVNEFWFDSSANIRQSKQFLAPGLDNMFIQEVID